MSSVGRFERLKHGKRIPDEALDVALVEGGHGIVVRPVPLVLQIHEVTGEVPNLDAEGTHVPAPARLLGPPVIQSPVDAHPAGLAASVPVEELVGAAFGETMEQGVVSRTDCAPKVGLQRPPRTGGDKVRGRG